MDRNTPHVPTLSGIPRRRTAAGFHPLVIRPQADRTIYRYGDAFVLLLNLLSLYLLAMAIMAVFWAVRIRTLNSSDYSFAIMLLCAAVCIYILGYAMELNSASEAQILFWNRVEYIGIPYVSALWLTLSLLYTGRFTRRRALLLVLIFGIPVLTMVFRLTNCYSLYFTAERFIPMYGILFLVRTPGPWMYVQMCYSMVSMFAATGMFVADSVQKQERQAGKIALTIAAAVFVAVGLVAKLAEPFGLPIDYMACCLPVTSILIILAITRYDLLATQSVVRDRVFQASSDALLLLDRQNRILDYNASARRLCEQIRIRIGGGYLEERFAPVPALLEGLKKEKTSVVELRQDGGRFLAITSTSIESHHIQRGWIKTIRDVTELYRLNAELKKQAMTDALSTLSNRRAFIQIGKERIQEAGPEKGPLHLVMLDLDFFKNVNDRYGHPAGDLVIREFSRLLKEHFSGESLVARLGGEEFAVLHTGLNDDGMLHTLRALQLRIEQHRYVYGGASFSVTASMGVTRKLPDQTLEGMMRMADKALYESKSNGRDCITFL